MSGLLLHMKKKWKMFKSHKVPTMTRYSRFCTILSHYPTGPEPQTQRLLLFSKKKKIGCWAWQSSWESFCLRGWMLLLNSVSHCASHHPIGLTHTGTCRQERCARLHRDKLSNRGRSVGREKGSCAFVLGQMTLAIELRKIIGHQTGRQATSGEPLPEDK